MEIAGYIASLIIGISLGLVGGGGSILTLPVLVYLFRVQPVLATAYSLFVVGSTSLVGAVPKFRHGLINIRTAIIFGIPSIGAVYIIRKYIVPHIPDTLFYFGTIQITKDILLMLLFAILMVIASICMIRNNIRPSKNEKNQSFKYPVIFLEGSVVGALTGLVGAGGGFLIIPALVLLSKLPMKQAVGTSLVIIAAKSLIGFTGDIDHYEMDWHLLLGITSVAIAGIFIGNWLNTKVSSAKLKIAFGWFVLMMGIFIVIRELFFNPA